jgi:23S rRNA pseudouridine1911/1915/1917 synthase
MTAYLEVIPAALAGERIDRVVALVTGCTRAEATELVTSGAATVNGRVVLAKASRLAEGDELALSWEEPAGPSGPEGDATIAPRSTSVREPIGTPASM